MGTNRHGRWGERQLICDYTFSVTDGTTTWRISVVDVDLNDDIDLNDTVGSENEDGYFLVSPDGLPPPGTNLTTGSITKNDDNLAWCSGGLFFGRCQDRHAQRSLRCGNSDQRHLVLTAHDGPQRIRLAGTTTVAAQGAQAPIVITAGTLGNTENLVVSSQNCIPLSDWRADLLYGQDEVLVRPVDLLNIDGVYRHIGGMVTYCQI